MDLTQPLHLVSSPLGVSGVTGEWADRSKIVKVGAEGNQICRIPSRNAQHDPPWRRRCLHTDAEKCAGTRQERSLNEENTL